MLRYVSHRILVMIPTLLAISLITFIIFYAPCFVTVMCIVRESGSWKWGAFSMAFNTLAAFTLASLVYQVGSLLI